MSRVRAPGGALERTVFEDVGAVGMVLFSALLEMKGIRSLFLRGLKVWRRIGRRMVARWSQGRIMFQVARG